MKEENVLFSKLLPLHRIQSFYHEIGSTIKTNVDISNYGSSRIALNNTIELLTKIGLIGKLDDCYHKIIILTDDEFSRIFFEKIFSVYSEEFTYNLYEKRRFDLQTKKVYFDRNAIPLKYAALFMLLNDYEEVILNDNKWIVNGELLNNLFKEKKTGRKISLAELEKRLQREKELGEEAEAFVLQYETQKLIEKGINKKPLQISTIDVTAGYDILSYGYSEHDEKYIEVKSSDNKMLFHFSNNELATAKKFRMKYWIYIFNRVDETIIEINNPYETLFVGDSDEWIIESDGYVIHKI